MGTASNLLRGDGAKFAYDVQLQDGRTLHIESSHETFGGDLYYCILNPDGTVTFESGTVTPTQAPGAYWFSSYNWANSALEFIKKNAGDLYTQLNTAYDGMVAELKAQRDEARAKRNEIDAHMNDKVVETVTVEIKDDANLSIDVGAMDKHLGEISEMQRLIKGLENGVAAATSEEALKKMAKTLRTAYTRYEKTLHDALLYNPMQASDARTRINEELAQLQQLTDQFNQLVKNGAADAERMLQDIKAFAQRKQGIFELNVLPDAFKLPDMRICAVLSGNDREALRAACDRHSLYIFPRSDHVA
jgi:hypothetical protein